MSYFDVGLDGSTNPSRAPNPDVESQLDDTGKMAGAPLSPSLGHTYTHPSSMPLTDMTDQELPAAEWTEQGETSFHHDFETETQGIEGVGEDQEGSSAGSSWNWTICDAEDATAWLEANPYGEWRTVSVDGDDDAEQQSNFVTLHAIGLFDAIFDAAPPVDRNWSPEKIQDYENYQKSGMEAVHKLTSTPNGLLRAQCQCILAIQEVFKFHKHGAAASSKTSRCDLSLKASDRISEMVKCVQVKHVAKAIIEGSSKIISDLVLGPTSLRKARQDASGGNSIKKGYVAAAKASGVKTPKKDVVDDTMAMPRRKRMSSFNFSAPSTPQSFATQLSGSSGNFNSLATNMMRQPSNSEHSRKSEDELASKRQKIAGRPFHFRDTDRVNDESALISPETSDFQHPRVNTPQHSGAAFYQDQAASTAGDQYGPASLYASPYQLPAYNGSYRTVETAMSQPETGALPGGAAAEGYHRIEHYSGLGEQQQHLYQQGLRDPTMQNATHAFQGLQDASEAYSAQQIVKDSHKGSGKDGN